MVPKAITVQFNDGGYAYERLLGVFIRSWQKNAKIPLEVHRIETPRSGRRHKSFYYNNEKLKVWLDNFNEDTVFVDCDMLLLKDVSEAFDIIDHIGIAERKHLPLNGGVIFAKYTKEAKDFMNHWYEIDCKMLEDPEFHGEYHPKYAGMNQASLGYLLENGHRKYVQRIPESFNLCESWEGWQDAHLIHVKGSLRQTCLRSRVNPPEPQGVIKQIWESYEQ